SKRDWSSDVCSSDLGGPWSPPVDARHRGLHLAREVLGGTRGREVEVEVLVARGGGELGQQLLDLPLRETQTGELLAAHPPGSRLEPPVRDTDHAAQRVQLAAREVRPAELVVHPGFEAERRDSL